MTKQGAGTLTVSGSSTYGGPTTIKGGILSTATLVDGGLTSGIGNSSAAASNLVLDGGQIGYNSASASSTNRQMTLTNNGDVVDSAAAGAITFTDTNPVTLTGSGARTFTFSGAGVGANTFLATPWLLDAGNP
jgi:fibronectin-binding autotransporter adhesin